MVQNSHSNSLTFTSSGLFSSSVGFAKIFEIAQILLKCYLLPNGSRPILNKVALEINNSGKNGYGPDLSCPEVSFARIV